LFRSYELATHLRHGGQAAVDHADRCRYPVPGGGAAVTDGEGRGMAVQQPTGGDLGIVRGRSVAIDEGAGAVTGSHHQTALEEGEGVLEGQLTDLPTVDQCDRDGHCAGALV